MKPAAAWPGGAQYLALPEGRYYYTFDHGPVHLSCSTPAKTNGTLNVNTADWWIFPLSP